MIAEIKHNLISRDLHADILSTYKRCMESAMTWVIRLDENMAFMPAGYNGPHYALETPVRNTCHWIVAYLIGEQLGLVSESHSPVGKLRNWLLINNIHYRNDMYVMRQGNNVDACNGVIGNAWVFEALYRLYRYRGDVEAKARLDELVRKNKFSEKNGAWSRYDSINNRHAIDYTFDHQAWIATALAESGACLGSVERFLDVCHKTAFGVRKDGRVNHVFNSDSLRGRIGQIRYRMREKRNPGYQNYLESGYQLYCLLPFARLRRFFPHHAVFSSDKLRRALGYCTYENLMHLQDNKYGFAYNAPGMEILLLAHVFAELVPLGADDVSELWRAQKDLVMSEDTGMFVRSCADPLTLSARIYEVGLYLERRPIFEV